MIKNKTKLYSVPRPTQKTIVIAGFLAYALQIVVAAIMWIKWYSDSAPFMDLTYGIYTTVALILPLVIFAIVYFMANNNATKLWRVARAMLVTVLLVVLQSAIATINYQLYKEPLGQANVSTISYVAWLESIPLLITLAVAVMISFHVAKSSKGKKDEAAPFLQAVFVGLMSLAILAQSVAPFINASSDEFGVGYGNLIAAGVGLGVYAVVFIVLYLLTSKKLSTLTRSFTAVVYMAIGVLLTFAVMYFALAINWYDYTSSFGIADILPMIVSLVAFVSVVTLHKIRKVI